MLWINFFPPPMLLWRGTSIPYFNISTPFFSYPRFSRRTFQLPGQNKQNHKRTYHELPTQTFRINPKVTSYIYFFKLLRVFSPSRLFHSSSNQDISPWLWNIFKLMMFRLLKNTCVSQKIESAQFNLYNLLLPPLGKIFTQALIINPQADGNYCAI